MKALFLIRHAKSSWDTALRDKDRSLNDRRRGDAPKMGKRLAKRDVTPDLILSSPARRALTTAEIIAKKLDYKLKDILVDDRLYAGAVGQNRTRGIRGVGFAGRACMWRWVGRMIGSCLSCQRSRECEFNDSGPPSFISVVLL